MKHKVRDEDVELFGEYKAEHVAPLEINPVQEAKNPSVLFRPLGAGPFEAGVLECVNPNYLRVLIEISTDSTQESQAATHIKNSQLVISPERKSSEGIGEPSLHKPHVSSWKPTKSSGGRSQSMVSSFSLLSSKI